MLCVNLKQYTRPCAGVSGGISRVWVFDPADFNFTQTEDDDPYSAIALRPGADAAGGALMYPILFQSKEADRQFTQSKTGASVMYDHTLNLQLPQLSHDLTVFLQSLDAAGTCCGLGFIIEHNDGKLFVMGEMYVNGAKIPFFEAVVNGTTGNTGKVFNEANAANVVIKAMYTRDLYEFSGGAAVIEALEAPATT